MFRVLGVIAAVSAVFSGSCLAEPIDSKAAKKLLFSHKATEIRIRPDAGLSETDLAALKLVLKDINYYAVAAIAPGEGLMSEATQAAAQHHSLEAATKVALSQCNSARKGGKPCVVVAEVVPKRYAARDLQLSQAATETFRRKYRRLRGEKAFAVSRSTGGWAFFEGDNAGHEVVGRCNTSAGVTDCETVIID